MKGENKIYMVFPVCVLIVHHAWSHDNFVRRFMNLKLQKSIGENSHVYMIVHIMNSA